MWKKTAKAFTDAWQTREPFAPPGTTWGGTEFGQGILNSKEFGLLWGQIDATDLFWGETRFWKPWTLIKERLIVKKQSSSIRETGKGVSKHKQA